MSGAIPPLPQYAFNAWCSIKKHRDNFTFYKFLYERTDVEKFDKILFKVNAK